VILLEMAKIELENIMKGEKQKCLGDIVGDGKD